MDNKDRHDDIDALIAKYLSDELDETSFNTLKEWTYRSVSNREYVRARVEEWFSAGVAADSYKYDAESAYRRFRLRIEGAEANMRKRRTRRVIRIAAAIVAAVLLPLAGYLYGTGRDYSRHAMISIETSAGAPSAATLPDGTKVWLNAMSRLEYPQDFGINCRNITLKGEACFDVSHDEKKPFIVHTDDVSLTVLGTKFTFSNYADDDNVTVDLIRGKVSLSATASEQSMYLAANERMTMDKRTGKMKKSRINAAGSDSWTHGEIIFEDTPLDEIAKAVSRRYGVEIKVADSIGKKRFYGAFDTRRRTAEDILEAISKTRRVKYTYKNGKYILYN